MFYFTMKSPRTSVLASSSSLDSDVLVKYEVSYLVTVIIELTFWECAGNTPVDSIIPLDPSTISSVIWTLSRRESPVYICRMVIV